MPFTHVYNTCYIQLDRTDISALEPRQIGPAKPLEVLDALSSTRQLSQLESCLRKITTRSTRRSVVRKVKQLVA